MPPKKLSESDKQEILNRYRQSDETTVSLAAEYGVSTSTISRILKQSLSEDAYESLIQRKRGRPSDSEQDLLPGFAADLGLGASSPAEADSGPQRRQRKRSAAGFISAEQLAASVAQLSQLEQAPLTRSEAPADPIDLSAVAEPLTQAPILATPETLATPLYDEPDSPEEIDVAEDADDEDDLDDLDEDDLDDLDEDDLDDYDEAADPLDSMELQPTGQLQILPFVESSLPRTCYVVVDRSSELITRPLKDFTNLGQTGEDKQDKTLPIFDNHRVAKRFLRRMQRIVKVPDGRVFNKVKPYLQAKGITHLLIDGQVYSLQ